MLSRNKIPAHRNALVAAFLQYGGEEVV